MSTVTIHSGSGFRNKPKHWAGSTTGSDLVIKITISNEMNMCVFPTTLDLLFLLYNTAASG